MCVHTLNLPIWHALFWSHFISCYSSFSFPWNGYACLCYTLSQRPLSWFLYSSVRAHSQPFYLTYTLSESLPLFLLMLFLFPLEWEGQSVLRAFATLFILLHTPLRARIRLTFPFDITLFSSRYLFSFLFIFLFFPGNASPYLRHCVPECLGGLSHEAGDQFCRMLLGTLVHCVCHVMTHQGDIAKVCLRYYLVDGHCMHSFALVVHLDELTSYPARRHRQGVRPFLFCWRSLHALFVDGSHERRLPSSIPHVMTH